MLAYLCGPMEFASDGGKMWRRKLTPFLTEQLGHRIYDPTVDERKSLTEEEAAHYREWKTTDVERFRRVLRKIIQYDLDLVENKADYVICHLDDLGASGVTSGGTSAELTIAYRKGIPVYLVSALGTEKISGWMLACADNLFDSVDTLKKFLFERYGSHRQSQMWKE